MQPSLRRSGRHVAVFTVVAATAFSALHATVPWHRSQLNVPHSAIALMPEGTPPDYAVFRALNPTVVAWGEDALPTLDGGRKVVEQWRKKYSDYRAIGAHDLAANVWMLTATGHYLYRHPELADTACVDLWSEKIIPSWLADADFKGSKPWWGCTNQPRFQDHLLARLRAGLEAGATMIHLDDHSGTLACATGAGGCFCPFCLQGFRTWLGQHVPAAALADAGINDLATFDYRRFLAARGYADRKSFITATWGGEVPLWPWFLAFQRDAAVAFVCRMQREAAQQCGAPVPFGVNAYDLQPKQLFDAHVIDYFANEVEQFGQEDVIPPVVYALGAAIGRPTFATGTGEDWIAYRQTGAVNRVRGWIAEAYAFGQYFMYAWNKWGYSAKTGTVWTQVDPEVFAPLCRFITTQHELFDDFENAAATGLLYDNAAGDHGHWGVRNASRTLLDAGVPYRLFVVGDEFLRSNDEPSELPALRTLVIPSDVTLNESTRHLLDVWQHRGGKLLVTPSPGADIPRADRIEISTNGRVWALPRVKSPSTTNHAAAELVIHLLNRDYVPQGDRFTAKPRVTLTFNPASFGGPAAPKTVHYYRPEAPAVELRTRSESDGRISIDVPGLDLWGVVLLSTTPENAK